MVIKNIFYLMMLQVSNYVIPLILLPLYSRVLSQDEVGAMMLTFALVSCSFVITDYGFSLSATAEISKNKADKNKLSKIVSVAFAVKSLMLVIVSFIIICLYFSFDFLYGELLIIALVAIFAQTYQPSWYFLGTQNVKNYTIFMAISKVLYLCLVVLFVNGEGDSRLVILFWGISHLVFLIVSIVLLRNEAVRFFSVSMTDVVREIKLTFSFFSSRLFVMTYTTATTLIVGSSGLNNAAVYSMAEQGYRAGQVITSSIGQALYPSMFNTSDWRVFNQIAIVVAAMFFSVSLLSFHFSEQVFVYVLGQPYAGSASIFNIMMITLLINFFGVMFGYPAMAGIGRVDIANRSVMFGAIFFFTLIFSVYYTEHVNGENIAFCILLTELLVFLYRLYYFIKLRLLR